jgi:DNA (cytosine-5)-methyltransferase 1
MQAEMRGDDESFLRSRTHVLDRPRPAPVTIVDLFSGCGGLTLGVAEAARAVDRGIDVRLAAEHDPAIASVYRANFRVHADRMISDVTKVFGGSFGRVASKAESSVRARVGPVDFLVGGPPCQGHSTLNNHTRGDDPKNRLYLRMARAAEILRPRVVLVENVPAVERDQAGVVSASRRWLEHLGYRVTTAVHSLTSIGVPQTRTRHLLVATRDGSTSAELPDWAQTDESRDLQWAIGDIEAGGPTAHQTAGVLSPENMRRARYLLDNDEYDLPNRLRPECQRGPHKYKSMYGRLRWDEPAQTITTGFGSPGQGRYFHPSRPRTLTAHEAARIQFIPDWFDFSALPHRGWVARAIGNAVPSKLSYVLALAALTSRPFASPDAARTTRRPRSQP